MSANPLIQLMAAADEAGIAKAKLKVERDEIAARLESIEGEIDAADAVLEDSLVALEDAGMAREAVLASVQARVALLVGTEVSIEEKKPAKRKPGRKPKKETEAAPIETSPKDSEVSGAPTDGTASSDAAPQEADETKVQSEESSTAAVKVSESVPQPEAPEAPEPDTSETPAEVDSGPQEELVQTSEADTAGDEDVQKESGDDHEISPIQDEEDESFLPPFLSSSSDSGNDRVIWEENEEKPASADIEEAAPATSAASRSNRPTAVQEEVEAAPQSDPEPDPDDGEQGASDDGDAADSEEDPGYTKDPEEAVDDDMPDFLR